VSTTVTDWVTVVARMAPEQADLAAGLLWDSGVSGVEERTCSTGEVELRAGVVAGLLDPVLVSLTPFGAVEVESVDPDGMFDRWREYARAWRAGSRIVVVPAWQACPGWAGSDDLVIPIDPGRAFGSGAHPTTRMCLTELELRIEPEAAVADIGCGSGVLAVAAARLGAALVVAIDVDPEAVRATDANAERNGVSHVVASATPVEDLEAAAYDIVVANMSSHTLVLLAPALARAVADDGTIVLSGLLECQQDMVLDAFRSLDFELTGTLAEEEWRTLIVARAQEPTGLGESAQ
jgi:ribosomal protein L11 methyltransferase